MMSRNRCLKFSRSLNEEESVACIALKATKYKPDIKHLLSIHGAAVNFALIVK